MNRRQFYKMLDDSKPNVKSWFKITNLEDEPITVVIKKSAESAPTVNFKYTDGIQQIKRAASSYEGFNYVLDVGKSLYIHGIGNAKWGDVTAFNYSNGNYTFTCNYNRIMTTNNKRFSVSGNLISLLGNTNVAGTSAFAQLLTNCAVVDASELIFPKEYRDYSFFLMFNGCSMLESIPNLSELNGNNTYRASLFRMFYGCSSLQKTNDLPKFTYTGPYAMTLMFSRCTSLKTIAPLNLILGAYGADGMFSYCTALEETPIMLLGATNTNAYINMFYSCTSLKRITTGSVLGEGGKNYAAIGTKMFMDCVNLENASGLTIKKLHNYATAQDMFNNCVKLTTPPVITATKAGGSSCCRMFKGCKALVNPPSLSTITTVDGAAMRQMFSDCINLINPPQLPSLTIDSACYREMFYNCKKLTTAPELPATTLKNYCYYYMFYGCTNLTTTAVMGTNIINAASATYGMYELCSKITGNISLSLTTPGSMSRMFYDTRIETVILNNENDTNLVVEATLGLCVNLKKLDVYQLTNNTLNILSGGNPQAPVYTMTLVELIIRADKTPADQFPTNWFNALAEDCIIKVHPNQLDAYKNATGWSSRAAYIIAIE